MIEHDRLMFTWLAGSLLFIMLVAVIALLLGQVE